jgi:hypothetical protein
MCVWPKMTALVNSIHCVVIPHDENWIILPNTYGTSLVWLCDLLSATMASKILPRKWPWSRLVGRPVEVRSCSTNTAIHNPLVLDLTILQRESFLLVRSVSHWRRTPEIGGNGGFSLRKKDFVGEILSRYVYIPRVCRRKDFKWTSIHTPVIHLDLHDIHSVNVQKVLIGMGTLKIGFFVKWLQISMRSSRIT